MKKPSRAEIQRISRDWAAWTEAFVRRLDLPQDSDEAQKRSRVKGLERDPEAWFKFYMPHYCTAPPAKFHTEATKRMLTNKRWYEVRAWSRELAKSTRAMLEIMYLALTGKIRNVLCVSATLDSAVRLLSPIKSELERNEPLANDYGIQPMMGSWKDAEFVARCGCSFRAIGAGQSPRGTRNGAARPDFILIDDIDTDEECRNPARIQAKWKWIEEALIPTLSVSGDYRILFNGNIIAKDCCITRAIEVADHHDVVNIRGKDGKSSWPEKNSEADIDYILSKISTRAAQQEYFNNPVTEGGVFKNVRFGECPRPKEFKFLVCYGDPAPSENRSSQSSTKTVSLCGMKDGTLYVLRTRLGRDTNSDFIGWFFDMRDYVAGACPVYYYIENNKLQDPFFQQVFKPRFAEIRKTRGGAFAILPDTQKKTDKATRIEANLEPLCRDGRLVLNIEEKEGEDMQRLKEQFDLFDMALRYPADGPDCVEGAWRIISQKQAEGAGRIATMTRREAYGENRMRL